MSGADLYYPWADIAADAGLTVKVTDTNRGWERRARSSGGFPVVPLGIVWHHAASTGSDEACVAYQVSGNPDHPVGNITLGMYGDVWPVAGGASNCAGKSERDIAFSRGVCPISQGNTYLVNIEVNNDGVGGANGTWSVACVDAYFTLSNAINAYLGNRPDDVISHALGAGDGYTNRKIDPATAAAVTGGWRPRSVTSSGTWSLADIRAECLARATTTNTGDDDMTDEQFARMMATLDAIAAAQQADFTQDATFGPKADQAISQRSAIFDALGSIGSKLDEIVSRL